MFRNVSAKRKGAAFVATAAAAVLLMTGCSASGSGSSGGSGSGSASDTLVAYTGQAGDYQINFNPYSPSTIGGVGEIFEPLFSGARGIWFLSEPERRLAERLRDLIGAQH